MEVKLAAGGGGIDGFGEAFESDAHVLEFFNQGDELFEAPPQAIETPHYDDVAVSEHVFELIEAGAILAFSTGNVLDDFFTAGPGQCILLQGEALILG